jgi:hypothetical protein
VALVSSDPTMAIGTIRFSGRRTAAAILGPPAVFIVLFIIVCSQQQCFGN